MTECAPSKCIFDYPDILDTLFQYLGTSDLTELMLTNKYFAESAKDAVFFRCWVMWDLGEFAESNVARYVRKLDIYQNDDYFFDMINENLWHNMPKLREVRLTCDFDESELRLSFDLLAKLKRFSARAVQVVKLPKSLPSSLEHLELINCNYIENSEALSTCRHSLKIDGTFLETPLALHSSLTHLWLCGISIQHSELPLSLISLTCTYAGRLPPLPSGLRFLDCSWNNLSSIGNLPSSLEVLICHHNNLTSLPPLPESLKMLCCSENPLADYFSSSTLESLPPLLKALDVSNRTIHKGFKPALPSGLLFFNCSNNLLSSLPLLPPSLEYLECSNNRLQSLPPLASQRPLYS